MPRITAGSPEAPDATSITRVDTSPENLRTMLDEDLEALLQRIRSQRESGPTKSGKPRAVKVTGPVDDDMENME